MKKISILGVTGSIGRSALNVYKNFSDELEVSAVSTYANIDLLLKILDSMVRKPKVAVVVDEDACYKYFGTKSIMHGQTKIVCGQSALTEVCCDTDNDIILNGISGQAGLEPSVNVLKSGINLALANKESMVYASPLLKKLSAQTGGKIVPVDSEHSAIFQLLNAHKPQTVCKIWITASGGPFLHKSLNELENVTVEQALAHPTWSMGRKISVDSATMANKGLEVIEAHGLFDADYDNIGVLIHPQSLVHSLVECVDGELYAQIGPKDMSLPIQNAIFYPEVRQNSYNRLDLSTALTLEFLPVDLEKWSMLAIAYKVGRLGGMWPAFYNIANEILVMKFLAGQIGFLDINRKMATALETFDKCSEVDKNEMSLENIGRIKEIANKIV